MKISLLTYPVAFFFVFAGQANAEEEPVERDVHQLRPTVGTAELMKRARAARDRGLLFLVNNQNADGSFGSHDPQIAELANFGFQLRNRGSQDGVRTACTALCAQALLELESRDPRQQKALEHAIEDLLRVDKIAYDKGESFNTWGYGYKLEFLTRLLEAEEGESLKERTRAAAQTCVDGLLRFRQHEGGWGYYSGELNDFESMSFNTAVFALALDRARQNGVRVPEGMIDDAAAIVQAQRVPDGSFLYSSSHIGRGGSILMNLGSGSRTVTCALALHTFERYDIDDLAQAMDVFRTGENYLEKGRKLITPHSAPHAVSGYFFFFGYYYAAEAMTRLGDRATKEQWNRHVWQMLRTQEDDGRWWDTASGHYGDKWGTAFALLTLNRYLHAMQDLTVQEF